MVANLEPHTDGDYDLPPRTGVLKKYKKSSSSLSANARRLQEQTRKLEVEAYKAVLRAFGAQSDDISWARFGLMSDLRKELRVTDDQHKELLEVANDAIVQKIRELKKTLGSHQAAPAAASVPAQAQAPARKRKLQTPERTEEAAPAPAPPPPPPPLKRVFQRQKKKTAAPSQPDLSTLNALQNEVERLESEPDMSRLAHAKTAAHELKRKILDALDQCGEDDEDSEKTAEERRDQNEVGEEAQEFEDEEKDVKTGMDLDN